MKIPFCAPPASPAGAAPPIDELFRRRADRIYLQIQIGHELLGFGHPVPGQQQIDERGTRADLTRHVAQDTLVDLDRPIDARTETPGTG